jgi:predicted TPR repeat methyltransferase
VKKAIVVMSGPAGWWEQTMEEAATTDRPVTVGEAIGLAVQLQQSGQFAAAEEIYRQVLAMQPDCPEALHFSGVLAHQNGRGDAAIALIERSLALAPDRADWHSNLGIVLQERLRLEEATAAYRRAIALDPAHANAHSNLGVLLRAQGKPAEAEASYREAIRLNPSHIDAWTNLGILLNGQKRTHEAVLCFSKVITLRPRHPEARRLLAIAHCTLGEIDKAIELFEQWLREEPGNAIATHMLAACSGNAVPARASDGFVESTFDNFASSFDAKLAKLQYCAPRLVAAVLESDAAPAGTLDVLDAGCGTGLCGPLIRQHARRLVGVDLSSKMLALAEGRHVYDELMKGELTTYLSAQSSAWDVIVSADTLVYFGALEDVTAAAAGALRPGGRLVFTVEELVDDRSGSGYTLNTHGRYSHSRAYVERVLAGVGLDAAIEGAELRLEAGVPVAGLVVKATKPVASGSHHA